MPEQKRPGQGRSTRPQTGHQSKSKTASRRNGPGSRQDNHPPRRPNRRPQAGNPKPAPPQAAPETPAEISLPDFEQPDYVVIAQVASPFGLRGAVKANIQTDFPERFDNLSRVFLTPPGVLPGDSAALQEMEIMSARLQSEKQVVLRFTGLTKVEQAEALRGYSVAIKRDEVVPLPEGEYYIFQIVGLDVYTTEDVYVGRVVNVERMPANDIYVVRGPLSKSDVLLPAIKDVVKEINLEEGRMTIELMEGLID